MRIIAIDAAPNLRNNDVWLALRLLFAPWQWQLTSNRQQLTNYFNTHYQSNGFLYQSGRIALYSVISSAIEPGDEVIIQAFTCLAVMNAVVWAGGKVVFADMNKDNYNIDLLDLTEKITSKTKAIIIQHTFGIPASINQIKKICGNKILLIEDCAHALGAKYKNQLVGTFGDAAIFSFNQDKVVSGVSGGAAIVYNSRIAQRLKKKQQLLTNISGWQIGKILLHPLVWALSLPLYESFQLGKGIIRVARKLGITGNTISLAEENGQMADGLLTTISDPQAGLINSVLRRLEKDNARRREIANYYRQKLVGLPVDHPLIAENCQPIYLRYPIGVSDSQKLLIAARRKSIILGKWYNTPVFPWTLAAKKNYPVGSCPVAEAVGKRIVNLPTSPVLSDKDIARVVNVVKEVYANN